MWEVKPASCLSMGFFESEITVPSSPQREDGQPWLLKVLSSGSTDRSSAGSSSLTHVCTAPKQHRSDCLLAANPLLALIDRPGSVRDFVIDGILTEPLNTVRLSWGRRFCNADTQQHVSYWLLAQPWTLRRKVSECNKSPTLPELNYLSSKSAKFAK